MWYLACCYFTVQDAKAELCKCAVPAKQFTQLCKAEKFMQKNFLPSSDRCWTRQSITHSQRAAYSFWANWLRWQKMKETEAKHSFKIFTLKNSNKRLVIGEELQRREADNFPFGGYMPVNTIFSVLMMSLHWVLAYSWAYKVQIRLRSDKLHQRKVTWQSVCSLALPCCDFPLYLLPSACMH